jgi:hypothetical protein
VLTNMISPQPPGRPHRFADGGLVGIPETGRNWQRPDPGASGGMVNNFNMSVNRSELFSADNLRRYFLPMFNEIMRCSK